VRCLHAAPTYSRALTYGVGATTDAPNLVAIGNTVLLMIDHDRVQNVKHSLYVNGTGSSGMGELTVDASTLGMYVANGSADWTMEMAGIFLYTVDGWVAPAE
jgi:hypothetical protein